MSHWEEADYLIINENFDIALTDLRAVVQSLRLRTSQQRLALNELIAHLLPS
jgi:guanylate kinase